MASGKSTKTKVKAKTTRGAGGSAKAAGGATPTKAGRRSEMRFEDEMETEVA